jgi:intein/homing endonuclease
MSNKMDRNNADLIYGQGTQLLEFYRNNPCIAAYELLGVDLAPIQRLVFEDMWFKSYVITVAGRGYGKTYLLGVLAALSSMLYPGYRVGLIGPVFRQSVPIYSINSDTYDTFWTNSGLKTTVKDFYESVQPGLTQIQSLDSQNTALSKWQDKNKACKYIKTTKGFELAGTIDHGIIVLDKNFNLEFKDLQDIKDDYIVIKTGFEYFGDNNSMPKFDEFEHNWLTKDCEIPNELTPDLSYWMGLLVGDGCVSISKNKRKQRVSFVSEDQDLLDFFENYLRKYFLIDKEENIDRRNRKNNTWEIEYYCKKLVQYLLKCDFTKTTALDKKIPAILKKASKENMVAFLQGLYDTDGGFYVQKNKGACIHFSTSSLQLAKEVHSTLLNLGIISNLGVSNKACIKQLPQGNNPSKCATGYKIRITGQTFIKRFSSIIGFRCERKKVKLDGYLNKHFKREDSLAKTIGLPSKIVDANYSKCLSYSERGLYFVKIVDSDYFFSDTIDIEVENEHCYWSNGFISHNSKMIFSEVEKLYSKSPILREACEKRPIRGTDTCYLKFKSVGGYNGSFIESLPLGDGNKIRGSRFYLILLDELAQIPDKTLDMVIRPMGATQLEPMANVRKIERQNKLLELGLITEDDLEEDTINKMIMTSSGYYKFNHMWRRMKDYWRQMNEFGENSKCAVWQIPYWDLPEGFLDKNNIDEAKRVMSRYEFRMEYEAEMISDSDGFFSASLLDSCTIDSNFSVEMSGDTKGHYVIGIDPNQGGSASCGVVVIRMGSEKKIVNAIELKGKTTQDMTIAIQELCKRYNIMRIFMDKGGGGKAIMDLLDEGYNGYEPIIDRTDDDKKHKQGLHILEMVNFNPEWISDANFTTKAMLEDKILRFPEPPISVKDSDAKIFDTIKKLRSQMLSIVVTQTATGKLHFDTPKKGQNKDLYSAIILAAHGARMIEKALEEDPEPVLYNKSGMVKSHNSSNWEQLGNNGNNAMREDRGLHMAILKKKL